MSDEGTPTVENLSEQLKDLVDWESFALNLPGINYTDIQIIRRDCSETQVRKMELFSCWIKAYPRATWEDVSKALKENHEFGLAQNVNLYQQEKRVEMARDHNIKLTVDALCSNLRGLSHWEELTVHLPGITTEVIDVVKYGHPPEDHMRYLFSKWLEICPTPSWDNILKAINETKVKVREKIQAEHLLKDVCQKVILPYMIYKPTVHTLTENLKGLENWKEFGLYLPQMQPIHTSSIDNIKYGDPVDLKKELFRVWLDIHPTARWDDVSLALDKSDNTSLAHALRANLPFEALHFDETRFEDKIRKETVKKLRSLYEDYQLLSFNFKNEISQQASSDSLLISIMRWVKGMQPYKFEKRLASVTSFDEFFDVIAIHHNFLNCYLPLSLARQFLKSDSPITTGLVSHSNKIQQFMESTEIQALRTSLEPFVHKDPVQKPITIKLHHCYERQDMSIVQTLLETLFNIDQSKLLQIFRITPGSVLVTLLVPQYALNELYNIVEKKVMFMRLVGVQGLEFKTITLLEEDNNYSYKMGLMQALDRHEYEAVKFLVKEIEVNVNTRSKSNYYYEETDLDQAEEQNDDRGMEDAAKDENANYVESSTPDFLYEDDDNFNFSFPSEPGTTPLMIACFNGDTGFVQLLLEKGADPNLQTELTRWTAIMYACIGGNGHIIRLLLKFKSEIDKNKEITALHCGCRSGNGRAVDVLLEHSADPNTKMKDGITPLHSASKSGHLEIVKKLLRAKANPDIQSNDRVTPLYSASEKGHYQVVDELLKANVRPDRPAFDGDTPLFIASHNGHLKVVKRLLKEKANPNLKAIFVEIQRSVKPYIMISGTPLMAACWYGHLEIVEALLQANADPNAATSTGTPLMFALEKGHLKIAKALMKNSRINVDAQTADGRTALFVASQFGYFEVVQRLIEAKANPNTRIKKNPTFTPLHIAQIMGHTPIVRILRYYGAV